MSGQVIANKFELSFKLDFGQKNEFAVKKKK